MPVDPSIALGVRGVGPIANPLDVMQGIQSMRTQREQTAALAEQRRAQAERTRIETENARIKTEDAQRAQREELQLRSVYQTFGDRPVPLATLSNIVGPERAQKLHDGHVALKEREVKSYEQAQGLFARAIGAVEALPENLRAPVYEATVKDAVTRGWLTQDEVQPFSPEAVSFYRQRGLTAEQQMTQARAAEEAKRAAATHAVTLPKLTADATVAQQVAAGTVGGLTPAQQADAKRAAAAQAETARHNRQTEAAARAAAARESQPGWQWVVRDGKEVYTNRVQAADRPQNARVKSTEDERKTAGFYVQMKEAIKIVDQLEPAITERELYQIQTLPHEQLMGMFNRNQLSENAKRYLRAFEEFTEARIRPVSGAVINDSEYERDRRTYAKQYGETPKLAEDRRSSRTRALEALKKRGGVAIDDGDTDAGGSVPSAVSSALSDQKDGRYTLSDGSTWVVEGGKVKGKG